MRDADLDDLAAELAEFAPPEKKGGRPASEERVIAGFEEIQRFTEKHGRAPLHGEDRDIFERLYAVRLDRLRALPDCRALLEPLDHQGLLAEAPTVAASTDEAIDIDDLAAELAGLANAGDADDITVLRHVRNSADKRAAEEVADRKPCEDFEAFKPLFERVATEVKTGLRQSQPIEAGRRAIEAGDFFVLDGITLYVAEVGEPLKTTAGEVDRRLRLIFPTAPKAICCCARYSARSTTTPPRGDWPCPRADNSLLAASLRPMMPKAARFTSCAPCPIILTSRSTATSSTRWA